MKLTLCTQMNINSFYKLIPLILMGMARPVQITQNNGFAKSLQYLKKEGRDEVDTNNLFSINYDLIQRQLGHASDLPNYKNCSSNDFSQVFLL